MGFIAGGGRDSERDIAVKRHENRSQSGRTGEILKSRVPAMTSHSPAGLITDIAQAVQQAKLPGMHMYQITPFVPCTSLERQIAFYRHALGFVLTFQAENYAFMRRDDVAIRLIEVDSTIDLSQPERQGSFYIDVHDIDALYEKLEPKLRALPEGRVRPPFNQDYGQRECHVIDEDCTLIFFGEAVQR